MDRRNSRPKRACGVGVLEALRGLAGKVLWWIGWLIKQAPNYLAEKVWIVVSGLGGSMSQGWHDVTVWIKPKT